MVASSPSLAMAVGDLAGTAAAAAPDGIGSDDGPAHVSSRPVVSYLVCTEPRTGSTLLCDALAETGVAGRPDEYFFIPSRETDAYWMRRLGIADQSDYVDGVIREATTPNGVFGVKMHWAQVELFRGRLAAGLAKSHPDLRDASFERLLREKLGATRYVWLRRRNKVAQGI